MSDGPDYDGTNLLFHFTKACVALDHILPTGMLRLTPLMNTGDPIEYRYFNIMISGTKLPEFSELNQPWNETVSIID